MDGVIFLTNSFGVFDYFSYLCPRRRIVGNAEVRPMNVTATPGKAGTKGFTSSPPFRLS